MIKPPNDLVALLAGSHWVRKETGTALSLAPFSGMDMMVQLWQDARSYPISRETMSIILFCFFPEVRDGVKQVCSRTCWKS